MNCFKSGILAKQLNLYSDLFTPFNITHYQHYISHKMSASLLITSEKNNISHLPSSVLYSLMEAVGAGNVSAPWRQTGMVLSSWPQQS